MKLRQLIRDWLRRGGLDVVRYNRAHHPEARRISLIRDYGITVVLDVGANTGQYALHLRKLGYRGRIVSLEPLAAEYAVLSETASRDADWDARNFALGDDDGRQQINVAANSHSSSLLEVLPRHLQSAPQAEAVDVQAVEVRRLDSVFDELCRPDDQPYLKLDAQGYEMRILAGAEDSLPRIDTIQLEMSLTPLYQGETLLPDMARYLYEKGYALVSLEPGHSDARNGQLMQVDGIFHRLD